MVANEILPNIWLSDYTTALDKSFLLEHGIKVVFNCTKNNPFTSLDIKKYRLAVNDSLQAIDQQEMFDLLPEMTKLMIMAYKTLTPMLVYCHVGIQRSATLIAAFLIRTTGINYLSAIKIIQTKRDIAFRPGINFCETLKKFSTLYVNDKDGQIVSQNNK